MIINGQGVNDVGKQWLTLLSYEHRKVLYENPKRTKLIIPQYDEGIDDNIKKVINFMKQDTLPSELRKEIQEQGEFEDMLVSYGNKAREEGIFDSAVRTVSILLQALKEDYNVTTTTEGGKNIQVLTEIGKANISMIVRNVKSAL